MTYTLLPNGRQQFFGSDGVLAGGSVLTLVPGTSTLKNTYQDPGQTTLNQNPVPLDSNGSAAIYGQGSYRQIVKDAFGNTIWDAPTEDTSTSASSIPYGPDSGTVNVLVVNTTPSITALIAGQALLTLVANTNTGPCEILVDGLGTFSLESQNGPLSAGQIIAGQMLLMFYSGTAWITNTVTYSFNQSPSLTVSLNTGGSALASASFTGAATSATTNEYILNLSLTSAVASGTAWAKGALYAGVTGSAGTGNIYAGTLGVNMTASSGNYTSYLCNGLLNNNLADAASGLGSAPQAYGYVAQSQGAFKGSAAFVGISTGASSAWRRGIFLGPSSISDTSIEDDSSSTTVLLVNGTHSIGLDFSGSTTTTFAKVAEDQPLSCLLSSSAIVQLVNCVSPYMYISDSTLSAVISKTHIWPNTNAAMNLGSASLQWATIYCVTLVQSSDERKKEILGSLWHSEKDLEGMFHCIEPMIYMRKNDVDALIHFGPTAQNVRAVINRFGFSGWAAQIGIEDPMINPTELSWLHWTVTQRLESRVKRLEALLDV